MRIEQLGNESGNLVVGVAELHNSNNLKQDKLIQLAASISSDSLTVQLLNALLVADEIHLLSSAQNAINAQQGDYMLSRSLDVEIIVYASAQKQIGKALDALGLHDGIEAIAAVVVGPDTASVRNALESLANSIGKEKSPPFSATIERIGRIKDHFQITDKEIDAISDSDDVKSQLVALSRCLVSRVSLVAFDS